MDRFVLGGWEWGGEDGGERDFGVKNQTGDAYPREAFQTVGVSELGYGVVEIHIREENEEREQCVVFPLMEVASHSGGCCIRISKCERTSGLDR